MKVQGNKINKKPTVLIVTASVIFPKWQKIGSKSFSLDFAITKKSVQLAQFGNAMFIVFSSG